MNMTQKTVKKPLKLVVSAIHNLKEKNGSSPQGIIRFLEGKHNLSTDQLKSHVKAGLKRGLAFGMLTQECGLYRLSGTIDGPLEKPALSCPGPQIKRIQELTKKDRGRKRVVAKKRMERLMRRRLGCIRQMKNQNKKCQAKNLVCKKKGSRRFREKSKRSRQRNPMKPKEKLLAPKMSSEIQLVEEIRIRHKPVSTDGRLVTIC